MKSDSEPTTVAVALLLLAKEHPLAFKDPK